MKRNITSALQKAKIARRKRNQKGLTLIELLVVLVILVGIGGLLVPTINNALSRTHVATCATSFPEVHQMMQRVQLEFGEFGTDFDSGIYEGGGDPVNNSAATFTLTGGGANGTGALVANALTANEVISLEGAGITSVVDHAGTPPNVTFDIGANQRTLTTGGTLLNLSNAQANAIFLPDAPAGSRYFWLGIGRDWSLLGNLAPEPPVHFGDTAGVLPDEVHSRFGIIMEVFENEDAAQFRRVSYCIDGDAFETGDNHIEVYWEEISGQ